jgi:hypothetical protein
MTDAATNVPITGRSILAGDYQEQREFADNNQTTTRTIGRYRRRGLPWIAWNGRVWIPVAEARLWLHSQIHHLKPTAKRRRA